jgi:hypothetical protein
VLGNSRARDLKTMRRQKIVARAAATGIWGVGVPLQLTGFWRMQSDDLQESLNVR